MRRSPWLTTGTLAGLAVLMVGSFAVAVRATQKEHNHCLNGCGPKQTPAADKCCEPPPCEYEYELKVTTAKVRSVAQSKKQVPKGPGQAPVKPLNLGRLQGSIGGALAMALKNKTGIELPALLKAKEDVLETLAAQFADCIKEKPFIKKQPFYVDYENSACTMSQGNQVINRGDTQALENAKNAAPECRESVEADWARATTLQDICLNNKGLNPATLPDAEQKAAEAAQRSMQEQLSQFLQSCKPFAAKFKSARDAVKKAEQMLKDSGGKQIPQNQRKFSGRSKKS